MFSISPRLICPIRQMCRALNLSSLRRVEIADPETESTEIFPVHGVHELVEEVQHSRKPFIVNFFVPWLKQSRLMSANIESVVVAKEGAIKMAQVDMDGDREFFQRYGITTIPCVIAFHNGKEVNRVVGLHSKDTIGDWLDQVIKESGYEVEK